MVGSSISVVRRRVWIACRWCRGTGTRVAADRRQQARQRPQRRQTHLGPLRPANRRASRPIEHPRGHIECQAARSARQPAAGDSNPLLATSRSTTNVAPTSPRMELVEDPAIAGSLGVRLSSCTTANAVTRPWAISARWRSSWLRTGRRRDALPQVPVRRVEVGGQRAARPLQKAGGAHRASSAGPEPTDLAPFTGQSPQQVNCPLKPGQVQGDNWLHRHEVEIPAVRVVFYCKAG